MHRIILQHPAGGNGAKETTRNQQKSGEKQVILYVNFGVIRGRCCITSNVLILPRAHISHPVHTA